MIPAGVQTALDDHVGDGAEVALAVLLGIVAVFGVKFLLRSFTSYSASEGIRRIFRR